MFAAPARDVENLVYSQQAGELAKQQGGRSLPPRTPGSRFNNARNENVAPATRAAASKSVIAPMTQGAKSRKAGNGTTGTPIDNRPRAILGDKTTNAKAKTGAPLRVKDISAVTSRLDKTQQQRNGSVIQRQRTKVKPFGAKSAATAAAHSTENDDVDDVEFAPPPVPEQPYESDVFPAGMLSFNALKPENIFNGYYEHYYNPIDENGQSRREMLEEEERRLVMEDGERKILEAAASLDWSMPLENEAALEREGSSLKVKPRLKTTASTMKKTRPAVRRAASTVALRSARVTTK